MDGLDYHRLRNLDRQIVCSRSDYVRIMLIKNRNKISKGELVMTPDGYIQNRITENTIVTVIETKGESKKTYTSRVGLLIQFARLDEPELPIEQQLTNAICRLEQENDAEIDVKRKY